jgi:hypothetical protein
MTFIARAATSSGGGDSRGGGSAAGGSDGGAACAIGQRWTRRFCADVVFAEMTLLLAIVASGGVMPLQSSSRSGLAVITSRPFALHVFFGRYFFFLFLFEEETFKKEKGNFIVANQELWPAFSILGEGKRRLFVILSRYV